MSSETASEKFIPVLGPLTALLIGGGSRRSSNPQGAIDRALGAAASLGISLAIFRFLIYAVGVAKRLENGGSTEAKKEQFALLKDQRAWYEYFRQLVRQCVLEEEPEACINGEGEINGIGTAIIRHQGSCHCESIEYEVIAPRCISAMDGPGKIQFRHTRVKTSNFRVVKGHDFLQKYYVTVPGLSSTEKKSRDLGAHAFCIRCGVPILYAPSSTSQYLEVNVNCLNDGIQKITVESVSDCLSEGTPTSGQWDQFSSLEEDEPMKANLPTPSKSLLLHHSGDDDDDDDCIGLPLLGEKKLSYDIPGTPSTVGSISAPDSVLSSLRIKSNIENDSTTGGESESTTRTLSTTTPPPIRSGPLPSEIPQTSSPQLRDQLKYYMGKHISQTPETANEEKKQSN